MTPRDGRAETPRGCLEPPHEFAKYMHMVTCKYNQYGTSVSMEPTMLTLHGWFRYVMRTVIGYDLARRSKPKHTQILL